MAQDPFYVDQVQIEPASAGVRKIRRNADGSLEFVDPTYSSGVKLSTLATAGTTALSSSIKTGAVSFVAEATKAVVFPASYADAVYAIFVEFDDNPGGAWWATTKTAAGFTINLAAPVTLGARWMTIRL